MPDPRGIRASYSGGAASASDRTSGGPLASARHVSVMGGEGQPGSGASSSPSPSPRPQGASHPQRTTAVIWISTPSRPTSGNPATVVGIPSGMTSASTSSTVPASRTSVR